MGEARAQEALTAGFDTESLINANDDMIHDEIMSRIEENPRIIENEWLSMKIPEIEGIIENLQCSLCLTVTE